MGFKMKTSEIFKLLQKDPTLQFKNDNGEILEVTTSYTIEYLLDQKWEIIREPVFVWEAFKALCEERKRIRCEGSGLCSKAPCIFDDEISSNTSLNWLCFTKGTWYIEP